MSAYVDLATGSNHSPVPGKEDIEKNIAAIRRYLSGKHNCSDYIMLLDTISILEGIKKQLT